MTLQAKLTLGTVLLATFIVAIISAVYLGNIMDLQYESALREAGRSLLVLLAEDNVVNQKLASRLLEKRGHRVVVVSNGREALAALDRQKFDLVLMDVVMPEMDGFGATAAIRSRENSTGTHLPIIAMTAHALKGDQERCLAAGMDGYIAKPIHVDELLKEIESVAAAAPTHVENGGG